MSKRIATISLSDIERISIVFGEGKTMAQVKGNNVYFSQLDIEIKGVI